MKKTTLKLVNDEIIAGYEVGNFVVYKAYYYWYIAHKSGYKLGRYFARRRDAVTVCRIADSLANWDFSDKPLEVALDLCIIAYRDASTWDLGAEVYVPNILGADMLGPDVLGETGDGD